MITSSYNLVSSANTAFTTSFATKWQGLRVFLSLCLYVFATLRLCDLFDCKNITKNLSRQTDNFDMIIDVVDER